MIYDGTESIWVKIEHILGYTTQGGYQKENQMVEAFFIDSKWQYYSEYDYIFVELREQDVLEAFPRNEFPEYYL